jgi:hypothetical protein
MKSRLCCYGLAIIACVALFPIPATWAQALGSQNGSGCQDDPPRWSQDRLAKFDVAIASVEQDVAKRQAPRQAMHWSQNQLSEFDAAIASLQQDVGTRPASARGKAEALLNELRDRRDAYRVQVREAAANMTAGARKSLDEAANAFWAKVDAYLDAVNAEIATRQAAMQTRFMGD